MNLFEKVNEIKLALQGVQKGGKNNFSNWDYFQLEDFLPIIVQKCKELKLFTKIDFYIDEAKLTILDIEKPEDFETYSSPMSTAQLKGCHEVQNLGAVETYLRRYLYMSAFDVIEQDEIDKTVNLNQTQEVKQEVKQVDYSVSPKGRKFAEMNDEDLEACLTFFKKDVNKFKGYVEYIINLKLQRGQKK